MNRFFSTLVAGALATAAGSLAAEQFKPYPRPHGVRPSADGPQGQAQYQAAVKRCKWLVAQKRQQCLDAARAQFEPSAQ
jgi:hypothetical protein